MTSRDGWLTPTNLHCGKIAALYGLAHTVAHPGEELEAALGQQGDRGATWLIEVPVDAEESWEHHRALWKAASDL